MKKIALVLAAVLLLGCMMPALAEMAFEGVVVASDSVPVEAPFGAMVGKLYVREGDMIYAGDPIVDLKATSVFAPSISGETAMSPIRSPARERLLEKDPITTESR